jgi:PPOX class probable F420-dependent enzyme
MELPALAKKLLQGKNFATVATVMDDGSPQATVVWVDTDGKHVIFNTADGRLKARNLRRDKRVAVAVLGSENAYQQAMIRGSVVEMTSAGADEHIDKLAKKYLNADKYPYRQPGEKRLIVKILPEKVALMGE